jgi:DNA-binding NtrC family response regulator
MATTLTQGLEQRPPGARLVPMLYRVLDADAPGQGSTRVCLDGVDVVLLGRGGAHGHALTDEGGARTLRLAVADRWMSSAHARLTQVMQRWVLEDTHSKNGLRVNGQPAQRAELEDGDVLELGRTFLVFRAAQPSTGERVVDSAGLAPVARGLLTLSPSLAATFAQLERVALSAVSVALTGPTGSGKEVLARAIHTLSRRPGPFVAVNCGALPDELVESELFGHRKGAFSGALEDRAGLVRAAHHGTLLLDEVGDLPLDAQPALLRVLQEKVVVPVGGTSPIPVDARVVSATHRDLEVLAARGVFRDDLRARLTGFQVALPALADRREDLGLLVAALLAPFPSATFTVAAARALMLWRWPLNVRELEKTLEAAAVLAGPGPIDLAHLPAPMREPQARRPVAVLEPDELDAARRADLERLLAEHAGNVSAVARAMGKARMQIQRWLARYGLDPRTFRR